jgi:hypothetical protein
LPESEVASVRLEGSFMRQVLSVVLLWSLLILSGCAVPTVRFHPVTEPTSELETFFVDGYEVAVSRSATSVIALTGERETQGFVTLLLAVRNTSPDQRADLVPERIEVLGHNSRGTTESLRVYAAHEYMNKVRASQSWGLAAQALSGALQAASAGWSQSSTTGYVAGSTGYANVHTTTTTHDPGVSAEVAARENAKLAAAAEQYGQVAAATESGLLKANTLFPGQEIGGAVMVKFDPLFANSYTVRVPIGNDVHEFILQPGR